MLSIMNFTMAFTPGNSTASQPKPTLTLESATGAANVNVYCTHVVLSTWFGSRAWKAMLPAKKLTTSDPVAPAAQKVTLVAPHMLIPGRFVGSDVLPTGNSHVTPPRPCTSALGGHGTPGA